MERDQARIIYKEIKSLFPFFNREDDADTAKLWLDRLQLGDYKRTRQKLLDYSMESTRTPTLAHILVREHKPINTEASDVAAMEEAVRREKEDPKTNAERIKSIERFNRRLEALEKNGRN